jgi:hypothetical protein
MLGASCYNSVTTLLQFVFGFVSKMFQLLKGTLRSLMYRVGGLEKENLDFGPFVA